MKLNKLLIVVAVLAIILSGFSAPAAVRADWSKVDQRVLGQSYSKGLSEKDTFFVRVPTTVIDKVTKLSLNPLQMIDYDTYFWLELNAADYVSLKSSKLPYVSEPEAGKIQVTRYSFDPLQDGEPELPDGMSVKYSSAGFRLVQFNGPIRDEWLDQLGAVGIRTLQYYPHNSYLVWGTSEQADQASSFDYVRWIGTFHPAYKINSDLDGRSGLINNVDIFFYDDGNLEGTLDAISQLGASLIQYYPSQPDRAFYDAIVQLDAGLISNIAKLNTVLWLGYSSPVPELDDEMAAQIVAGNYTAGVPFTGYNAWLSNLGLSGEGVIWGIIDTGVDYQHPDLNTHIVGGRDYPGACTEPDHPGTDCPAGGHGTHVAGIVGGDASAGYSDPSGFLYGLGIAPSYSIFASNSLSASAWPPAGGWQEHSKWAVLGGAVGGNNSWTTGEGTNHGYQTSERTHDIMVLDGNWDTASIAEPFIEVFSAGNSGPAAYTLTAPKEAKNLTIAASTQNYRVGSIDVVSSFSSRGPAADLRWVPTVASPGEQIASTRNDTGGSCSTPIAGTNNMYAYCSGTSMAAPQVSGSIALITEWWRNFNSGANPSSAMAKALLVNGAVDMGTADIPNANEGWGRVNLTNIFDNNADMVYYDQPVIFANTGDAWQVTVGVVNPALPLKVTLAWADAPGAVGANPALVNNLDLTVTNGSNTYLGNVFSAGWSQTGGSPDTRNNLENVFIQSPSSGATITIQATNIAGDAILYNGDPTDQSFTLVCYNCALRPDFTLEADPLSAEICAPSSTDYAITVGSIMGFSDPVSLVAQNNPLGTTASFDVNPVTPPGTSVFTIDATDQVTAGSYDIDVIGNAPTQTHTVTVGLDLYTDVPDLPVLLTPYDGAFDQSLQPDFDWEDLPLAGSYNFDLSYDPLFDALVITTTGLTESSYALPTLLAGGTCYWWRAQGNNACGTGQWASPFHFSTVDLGVSFSDDLEAGSGNWTHQAAQGVDHWALSTAQSHSPTHAWFVPDDSVVTDSRLWNVAPFLVGAGSELSFWHRYQFEGASYDGSVLEISINGGSTWTDLGPDITANGYNGTISTSYSNPLGGRQAWTGDLTSWTEVTVNLSAYAGQNALIRWRIGCDSSVSDVGWYIDDVQITAPLPPNPAPSLTGIEPDHGSVGEPTPLSITGTGFFGYPALRLGDTWLLSVTVVSTTTIEAVVPSGMALGLYDLELFNGDCQSALLEDAFTIGDIPITGLSATNDSPTLLGDTTTFTATVTGGTSIVYTWDFGDGGTATGAVVTHVYDNDGDFTATVTATNSLGSEEAETTAVIVLPKTFLPIVSK